MIDHLSPELKALYPGPPKDGDVRVYKLLGIQKKRPIMVDDQLTHPGRAAYTIPNTRGLASSYLVKEEDGSRKTIAFVERELPTNDPMKSQQQLGEVVFRQEDGGEIRVTAANYDRLRTTDIFLFFCPWLRNNIGKSFHIRNKLGYFIEMESREERAQKFLEEKDIIFDAQKLVREMSEEDRDVLVSQMQLGVPDHMSPREKLERLVQRADTLDGARRILTLSNDKDTILRKLIKTAFSLDIIKKSSSGTEILWSKGGEPVCTKVPKRTLEDSLILYFATDDGAEVLRILKDTVQSRQEAKKEKQSAKTEKAEVVKDS